MSANLDSYTTGISGGLQLVLAAVTSQAQSFTPMGSYNLNSCEFFLSKTGTPTGNAVAKLYSHSGTYGSSSIPTGAALATSDSVSFSSIPSGPSWITFTFSTPYALTGGTNYCIAVEVDAGIAGSCLNGYYNSSGTHPGNYSSYTSPTWTPVAGTDLGFRVITSSSPVAIRAVGTPAAVDTGGATPTIPADTTTGDLMILIAYSRVNSITFTCSAGWTEDYDPGSQTTGSYAVYSRFWQSGDGNPTVTPSSNESLIAVIISLYNTAASSFYDVAIAGTAFTAPTTPFDVTLTGFNTATNEALAFFCWGSVDDNTYVYQSGGGAQLVSQNETAGTDAALGIAAKSLPTAGGTGDQVNRQSTKGGDAGRKLWFAVKPGVGTRYLGGTAAAATALTFGTLRLIRRTGGTITSVTSLTSTGLRRVFRTGGNILGTTTVTLGGFLKRFSIGGTIASVTSITSPGIKLARRIGGAITATTSILHSGMNLIFRTGGSVASVTTLTSTGLRQVFRTGGDILSGSVLSITGLRRVFRTGGAIASTTSLLWSGMTRVFRTGGVIASTSALVGAVSTVVWKLLGGTIVCTTSLVGNLFGAITWFIGGAMVCSTALATRLSLVFRIGGDIVTGTSLAASALVAKLLSGVAICSTAVVSTGMNLIYRIGGLITCTTGGTYFEEGYFESGYFYEHSALVAHIKLGFRTGGEIITQSTIWGGLISAPAVVTAVGRHFVAMGRRFYMKVVARLHIDHDTDHIDMG